LRRDLTWFAESWFHHISDDGKVIVFDADDYNIYMRNTDKVGLTGMYVAVSPDRNHYIYAAGRNFSALYVVDGLK
jgi:hypothetical protein